MDKLIITVAGDSRTSYPQNHLCPTQEDIPGVRAAVHRRRQGGRRDRAHPRAAHARGIDPGRRQAGLAHPSRRLEAAARRDHEQGRSDHAVRRRLRAHRGEDQADEARPRHDGGRLQRARRIFPARPAVSAQAHDGDPSGRGADRLRQGRRGAQGQARMRVLPDRRVLASRIRAQAGLPEGRPTSRCSSAGPAAPGRRRPSARCSSSSTTCRRTASGTSA